MPSLYLHMAHRFLLTEQSAVSSENLDTAQKRNGPRVSLFHENPRKRSRPMIAYESKRKGDSSWELKIRHGHHESQKRRSRE